ncbi:CHAD domain-containing protein [Modicisalibacter xianhensis]|uniref:CHAD domain-containing protein n=1 Tax=Modicisalibacter xianhensis TaxID=442341 RepID=A0A1I3FV93_9GAMM|nr:CHAD domain-containing protein [Halomonas xianhensis]SFI14851.1 CHAD domain-containing protein [Halomonas xianhensis]
MTHQDYLHDLIAQAGERLTTPLDDKDVHELRLTCKRLRAAWQLQRVDLPRQVVKTREETPKTIAKSLEGSREMAVRHAMLGWVMPRVPSGLRPSLARLRATMAAQLDKQPIEADRQALLEAFQGESRQWDDEPLTRKRVRKGLKQTRSKVQRLARRSEKKRDPTLCHRWRKWVKYLTYQQDMSYTVEGKPGKAPRDRLKTLAKRLGRQHDLVNLNAWLKEAGKLDDATRLALGAELDRLAEEQLDKALRQGKKLGWL